MRPLVLVVVAALLLLPVDRARADDAKPQAPGSLDDAKTLARASYLQGVALIEKSQWSDGLAAFEASAKAYSTPATTLAIGSCERALGRYVRARATFERALSESPKSDHPLPESSVTEATGFIAEIDRVLARLIMTVEPRGASIAIDGRPLTPLAEGTPPTLAAGVSLPGVGAPAPSEAFVVVLDPGVHVITLSRKGFTDAVVNRTVAPGSSARLDLKLDLLPATMKVTSSHEGALVRVDGDDEGPAPVEVRRPAGVYRVQVKYQGFIPYQTQVTLQAGEELKLRATLVEEKPSLLSRWWFWTAAATVLAGGALITYAATRPASKPPPFDGGTTGWVIPPSAMHF